MKYKTVKLKEIADIVMGQSPKSDFYNTDGMGTPFLQGVRTFGDNYPIIDTYTTLFNREASAGQILFSVRAPVGRVNWATQNIAIGRGLAAIKVKSGYSKDYLYYLFKRIGSRLDSLSTGTVFTSINKKELEELSLNIPIELTNQERIANYLKRLDLKIDLNNQINANLLELAKTIFEKKYNATKYIPMSKLAEVKDGTHNSPKQQSIGYPLVTSKAIKGMSIDFSQLKLISKQDFNKINERSLVEHGDILFSMIGTVGLVYKVIEDPVNYAIKNVGLIKTHESVYSTLIYLSLISSRGHEYVKSHMSGSTQQFLSLTNLRKFPIPDISKAQLYRLNYLLNPIFNEIENLAHQNRTLNKAKNRLLSKLLN
ncbi:hypothetical protein HCY92_06505 [Limosilactobacillus fermentum]